MSIKLDLSKFKHLSSDKHSTTLQHADGHCLTLAHHKLHPDNKKQLEALAKGGEVGVHRQASGKKHGTSVVGASIRDKDTDSVKMIHEKKLDELRSMDKPKLKGLADGGYVDDVDDGDDDEKKPDMMATIAKMGPMLAAAEGGVVGAGEIGKDGPDMYAKEHQLPCLNPNCKSHGAPHPNCRCYGGGGEWGRMAKGGKVTSRCAEGMPHDEGCEYYKEGGKVGDNKSRYANEQGVHTRHQSSKPGQSLAGSYVESGNKPGADKELRNKQAKSLHSQHLEQSKNMPKPKLQGLAKGGDVLATGHGGISQQGKSVRLANKATNRHAHNMEMHDAKEEAKSRAEYHKEFVHPKLKGLADGGNVQETPAQAANRKQMELMTKGAQEGGAEQRTPQSDTNRQAEDEARFADGGEILPPGMQKPEGSTLDYKKLKKEYIEKKKQIKIDDRGKTPHRQHYAEGTPEVESDNPEDNVEAYKKHAGDVIGHAVNSLLSRFKGGDEAPPPPGQVAPAASSQPQMPSPADDNDQTSDYSALQNTQPAAPAPDMQNQAPNVVSSPQPSRTPAAQPQDQDVPGQQVEQQYKPNSRNMPEYNQAVEPVKINPGDAPTVAQQHALDVQNDLKNGHITPQTISDLMYNGKSTFGKIRTIFGLMVSGAGAGLTGQPNALIDAMQKQIDRDLHAQETSKTNAQNLLKLNQQYVRNNADVNLTNQEAAALSRVNAHNTAVSGMFQDLVNETNKLPEGPSKEVQKQMLGTVYGAMQNSITSRSAALAGAKALYGAGNQTATAGSGGPDAEFQAKQNSMMNSGDPNLIARAQREADRHMSNAPEIAGQFANRPIEGGDRDKFNSMNVLSDKAQDVLNYAKQHKGSVDPAVLRVGAQKAHELQAFYSKAVDSGAMTQGRMAWLDEQIKKNPTSVFQDILGNNKQLKEILDSNNTRKNSLLKSYGFTPKATQSSSASSQQAPTGAADKAALQWAQDPKNAKDPRAARILQKLGR